MGRLYSYYAYSGSNTPLYTSDWRIFVDFSSSTDNANNSSTVNCSLYFQMGGDAPWNDNVAAQIFLNGVYYNIANNVYQPNTTPVLIGSISVPIGHNSEGNLIVGIQGFSQGIATEYTNYVLPTIPRVSNVAITPFIIGQNATVTIGKASSNFTDTITYEFGTLKGTIATKTTNTNIVYKFPDTFYGQMPNSKMKNGKVICQTYNGETLIGTSESQFTATATGDPVINSISIVDNNATTKALTGNENIFIKDFSNANINVSANAINSATLISNITTNGDKSINTLTGVINNVKSGLFTTVITDSREYTNNKNASISGITNKQLVEYIQASLTISQCNITRLNELSKVANIDLVGNYWNKNFGAVANTIAIKLQARETGTTNWAYTRTIPSNYIVLDNTNNKFSVSDFPVGDEASIYFDSGKQYDFEIWIEDKLVGYNETKIPLKLDTGKALYEYYKEGMNVNGYLKNNNREVITYSTIEEWEV